MLDALINTSKIWYAQRIEDIPEVDENGDYTGEKKAGYGEPHMIYANISACRGLTEYDIFGNEVNYSNTLSTTKTKLPINEQTLLWDEKPEVNLDGTVKDPTTAKYRVAAIARSHYHTHYALRQLTRSNSEVV